ncbi:MAG: cell envelope integrity protein TolA, partial [Candidatus Competibacteraceae bacterium]
RQAEVEAAAETKRKAAAEAKRQAEVEAAAETKRKAAAEAKRQAEIEAAAEAKRKAEVEAAEEAKRKAAAEAKRKAEAAAAEAKRRAEEARKLAQELAAREAHGQFIKEAILRHAALIKQRVERNWSLPMGSSANQSCTLRISMTPSGVVTDVQIVQSSGDTAFDNSAIAAVQKASPLPAPSDAEVLAKFRTFNFRFKPGG